MLLNSVLTYSPLNDDQSSPGDRQATLCQPDGPFVSWCPGYPSQHRPLPLTEKRFSSTHRRDSCSGCLVCAPDPSLGEPPAYSTPKQRKSLPYTSTSPGRGKLESTHGAVEVVAWEEWDRTSSYVSSCLMILYLPLLSLPEEMSRYETRLSIWDGPCDSTA